MFCDDLDGWDWGVRGRLKREGIYMYIYIYTHTHIHTYIHIADSLFIPHCEGTISQFKKEMRIDLLFSIYLVFPIFA